MSQGNARWGIGATGAPGPTGPPGPAGPPGAGASGAALFELAPVPSPVLVGRYSAGSGTMQFMAGPTAMGMMPVFTLTYAGLVPAPVTTSGRVLQDDGTWVAQTGGGGAATGVTLGQQAVAGPFTLQGRFTLGTGTREDLAPGSVASLIGSRWGSGMQLLQAPTAVRGGMLRDDGQFVLPSFVASGIDPTTQLLDAPPKSILGRFQGASGNPQWLTIPQVASLLPRFAGSGVGMVPAPTGGAVSSGAFLRADGLFAAPTGLQDSQFSIIPPSTIRGRSGSSGIIENMVPSAVATMLPLFNAIDKGLVPGSAGGNTSFLRADGAWAAPSVAGSVSGVAFAQLQDISFPKLLGRLSGSGSIQELAPGSVASLIPPFFASGARGIVLGPTGGAAGNFLRDDGAWAAGGGTPTGLLNSQFAFMAPMTIKARTGPTGAPEDLVPSAVATMLPLFNNIDKGLVPGSGGGTTAFLRADGAWSAPAAGGAVSGVAFNQLQDITGRRLLGRRPIGSGTIEELTPETVATMLPVFSGALRGMVPPPPGGGPSGFFLKDDGSWFPLLGPQIVRQTSGGSATLAGSMTIDFSTAPFHEITVNANTKFYITPPSMMRHTQAKFISGASGCVPTFFGSMVKWAGGSAAHAGLFNPKGSGTVYTANFFWGGSFMEATIGSNFA